jgi:hypothetical protein
MRNKGLLESENEGKKCQLKKKCYSYLNYALIDCFLKTCFQNEKNLSFMNSNRDDGWSFEEHGLG